MDKTNSHLTPEQQAELQKILPAPGDCVFFRTSKKEARRNAKEVKYQGHGFGIFLGHVPQNAPAPNADDLFRLMGSIGFMMFDDLAEFLDEESAKKCVQAFEKKYYGAEAEARAQEIPKTTIEMPAARPKLVDMNGTPINSNEAPLQDKKDETTH